jgi:pyruvate,water dikinase
MKILKKIFPNWGTAKESESADQLSSHFKIRHNNYKLLVGANNKILEIISEMERLLNGEESLYYGASFIKSKTTALSVNVLRAIKNLDTMAPNKYEALYKSFNDIREKLDDVIEIKTASTKTNAYTLPLNKISRDNIDAAGSKIATLGEIKTNLPLLSVPNGFVITSYLYEQFMAHNDLKSEIERLFQIHSCESRSLTCSRVQVRDLNPHESAVGLDNIFRLSSAIGKAIMDSPMPPKSEDDIYQAYRLLEDMNHIGVRVSLRSSASAEDSIDSSFAGQYASRLNVAPENIITAYKEVLVSMYSASAIAYRQNMGLWDEDISMCVGCMVMIDGVAGGVIYTRNPLDIMDDSIIITSVFGLPTSVVDGTSSLDTFTVSRQLLQIVNKDIPPKNHAVRLDKYDGLERVALDKESCLKASINDYAVIQLAKIALELEGYFLGISQDIEWAIDEQGEIFILQCRPFRQISANAVSKDNEKYAGDILIKGGNRASLGIGAGQCYIVDKEVHMLTFPDKSILIAPFAIPKLAALLGRASAVITQEGSLTGHLASVAREYKIPAIFNVPNIMEMVSNGEQLTVDADNLIIYKGIKDDLLKETRKSNNIMKGTPIEKVLENVLKIVAPLNLLDPDSDDFRPEKCKTYHDIIRFCHEKSVNELFAFGRQKHYSRHTCKELISNLPLHWLVIDLEDGFNHDVKGKKVHLKDISSAPFLSLWDGLTAVTWNGPQHIDVGGFLSVVLRHNSGGDAALSGQTSYENDNYVLLSRHFFSLTSRLGYHFCTIEALAGERKAENYAGFYFKGGAADWERRNLRVRFIADILENFQFNITLKGDSLRAKVNALDADVILIKIKILGYMLMHTRQLDMVMLNPSCVQEYRTKFITEINTMILSK